MLFAGQTLSSTTGGWATRLSGCSRRSQWSCGSGGAESYLAVGGAMQERLERPLQAASQVFSLRLAGLAGRAGSHRQRGRGSKLTTLGGQGAARTDSRACPTLWLRAQVPQTCALCPVSWLVCASVLALQTSKAAGWTATPWTLQVGTRTKPECWLLQPLPLLHHGLVPSGQAPQIPCTFPGSRPKWGSQKGTQSRRRAGCPPWAVSHWRNRSLRGDVVWCCAPGGGAARSA